MDYHCFIYIAYIIDRNKTRNDVGTMDNSAGWEKTHTNIYIWLWAQGLSLIISGSTSALLPNLIIRAA